MQEFDDEQLEEMFNQVQRYENSKLTGEKTWFDADNYLDIIEWYSYKGMDSQAEQVIIEAYNLYPNTKDFIYRYAEIFADKGDYQTAIDIIKKALEENSIDELYIDLAALYIDAQMNLDEALDILFDALKKDSNYYFIYMLIGRIYIDKEDYILAESYLRRAVELNCNDKITIGCYTECTNDSSLKETMIRFLYDITQKNPFNDLLWTALGIVYYRFEFIDEAIEAFDYAIAINPNNDVSHSCKADCLIEKKDYQQAKKEIQIAIDLTKNEANDLHIVLASILLQEKNYAQALIHLESVYNSPSQPEDNTYLLDLALCYYNLGRVSQAADMLYLVDKNKVPTEFVIDFARKLYDCGLHKESEDIFEQIVENTSEKELIELAYVTLAALKSKEGHTFEAIKIMENTLIELDSCSEDFWYAFLRITCQDEIYDSLTTKTLELLKNLDSFPTYLKEFYPEVIENPNYKRCLKSIYQV